MKVRYMIYYAGGNIGGKKHIPKTAHFFAVKNQGRQ